MRPRSIYDLIPAPYLGIDTDYFNFFAAKQDKSNWCWAACIQMILHFYGIEVSQEELAKKYCGVDLFGRPKNCGATNEIITQNLNLWIWDSENAQKMRLYANVNLRPPTAAELFSAMQEGTPIMLAYKTDSGNGHGVVLTGVSYEEKLLSLEIELKSIVVRDPSPTYLNQINLGRVEYYSPNYLLNRVYAWWLPKLIPISYVI